MHLCIKQELGDESETHTGGCTGQARAVQGFTSGDQRQLAVLLGGLFSPRTHIQLPLSLKGERRGSLGLSPGQTPESAATWAPRRMWCLSRPGPAKRLSEEEARVPPAASPLAGNYSQATSRTASSTRERPGGTATAEAAGGSGASSGFSEGAGIFPRELLFEANPNPAQPLPEGILTQSTPQS